MSDVINDIELVPTEVINVTVVNDPDTIQTVVSSVQGQVGPPGPQGPPGEGVPEGGTEGQVLGRVGASTDWLSVGTSEEVDTKIAAHTQAEVVHTQATSGRDFSALFQNGLI